MVANLKFEDIDATLNQGQIFSSKAWKILIIAFYVTIGIEFVICMIYFIGVLYEGSFVQSDFIAIICCSVFSILFLIGTIIAHKCLISKKKKITALIEDSLLLKANATAIDEQILIRNFLALVGVALRVSFVHNGILCVRQSTYKDKPLCLPVYKKYVDRDIIIAYSPKYDEVLLIKPESARRLSNNDQNK